MEMNKFFGYLGFTLLFSIHAHAALELSSQCKSPACLEMELNWGSDKPKFKRKEIGPNSIFTFSVKGKLNDGLSAIHEVQFKGFTDGMECTDFGQGNVAVVGLRNKKPIVETQKGVLEVEDDSIRVGCKDCIRIMDERTKKVLKKYISPAWDLSLAEIKPNQISYDLNGSVYISKGKSCLIVPEAGLFSKADQSKCQRLDEVGSSTERYLDFVLEPAEWLLKLKNSKTILLLSAGACT